MLTNKKISNLTQVLGISVAVIVGAQIYFNLFNSDFRISIGIFVFSISVILFGEYPIIPVTYLSAIGVLASRTILHWLGTGTWNILSYFPEMVFYLIYGFLFYTYCRKENYELSLTAPMTLFFCDFLSNFAEVLLRQSVSGFTQNYYISIILVALLRSMCIWFLLFCLRYYKFSLLKHEHAQRYQRLLLLISKLNDEVVLMQKDSKMIEETMNISYKLFQEMEEAHIDEELSRKALNVAKDVHELKKEYALILRGISEALDLNLTDEGMYLSDIFQVLDNSLNASLPEGKQLSLDIQIEENLYTDKHYFFMSVMRNLLNNAIEASVKPDVHIKISETSDDSFYIFKVEDDGPGISPEDLEQIFYPGFSTKINYDTGEVNRGLGLNLVKDLVENQWHGVIRATSQPGQTVFTIHIPQTHWKGETK